MAHPTGIVTVYLNETMAHPTGIVTVYLSETMTHPTGIVTVYLSETMAHPTGIVTVYLSETMAHPRETVHQSKIMAHQTSIVTSLFLAGNSGGFNCVIKEQQAEEHRCIPIAISVCSIFLHNGIRLPGIFNVRTDVYACDCTRGLYGAGTPT